MELDSNLLLTAEKLRLELGLLRGKNVDGTFAFKRVPSQTYLVVNELEARVLEEFTSAKNVPDALEACIRRRCCTPLREFYDLVLKAHRAGVLRSEELGAAGPAETPHPPLRWFVPIPALVVLILACSGIVATLAAAVLRAPVLPATAMDVLLGWVAACGAMSLGQVLAAGVLRSARAEIHRPHLRWSSLTPHFAFDLSDRCMVSRRDRVAMTAAQLLPLVWLTGVAIWLQPPWQFLPLAALFVALIPVGPTHGAELIEMLRRKPLTDTDRAPLFDAPLSITERWEAMRRHFDLRLTGIQLASAIVWVALIGLTVYRALQLDPVRAFKETEHWETPLVGVDVAIAVIVLWWIANTIQHNIVDAVSLAWRRWSTQRKRWINAGSALPEGFDAEAIIRRNPLLRRLDIEVQMELAQHVRPMTAKAWSTIFKLDEAPAFVALIVSGSVSLHRKLKSGRKVRFLRVVEGDLFGAHALVDPDFTSLSARANTPLCALTIDRDIFQRLVIDTLGPAAVRNYVHKHLFLQRASAICADWRPTAVARFAELAATSNHSAGGKIIRRGDEVGSLFVLYEGEAQALQNGKTRGRIEPGDFFGEISLLQTSAATADVESRDDSRCLVVQRVEFIRFMARNHHVALHMERLCSRRLGYPVFPLDDRAFDAR